MKTKLIAMAFLSQFILTMPAFAEEEKPKLNISDLTKQAELLKKYKALIENPEGLQAMMRLAESLKKNKQTDN
jgi:hypothetical protein